MACAVLCDIEGTLGSISFVHDTLFPYARQHLAGYIRDHQSEPDVARELDAVAVASGLPRNDLHALVGQLLEWIDQDRKATPLKALQGRIWLQGYRAGNFRSHIYEDAHRKLLEWHAEGHSLAIYSSGSVAAQRLYFQYSSCGDLSHLISAWFDTTTGPKQDPASYAAITGSLGMPARQVLFLSDSPAELDAARLSGLRTTWLVRDADAPLGLDIARADHPVAKTFDDVAV